VTTAIASRRPSKTRYNEDQVRAALLQVAHADGSAHRALPGCREKGLKVSRKTLERWRDQDHAELYAEVRSQYQSVMQAKHGAQMEDLISTGFSTARRYWQRADEVLEDLPARDVPGGLRNVGVTLAIQVQRGLELREKPGGVPPPENRTPDEILRSLKGIAPGLFEFPDDEPPDATVVENASPADTTEARP
jgi:hypothetical protein